MKGLYKTLIWTQLTEAIEKDFSIKLPRTTGPETTKVINNIAELIPTTGGTYDNLYNGNVSKI